MELRFNVTGADRKKLVATISEIAGHKAKYLGMPSVAYEIGEITVDKQGTVTGADEHLAEQLSVLGFDPEPAGEIASVEIEMPRSLFSDTALDNLLHLIASKETLIKKALNCQTLDVEITADILRFPWISNISDADTIQAYTHFISKLCEMARSQSRINSTEKAVENEKYAFRCFLLRLGFIGNDYKIERKILLQNLTGSSAFKGGGKDE